MSEPETVSELVDPGIIQAGTDQAIAPARSITDHALRFETFHSRFVREKNLESWDRVEQVSPLSYR